MSRFYNHETIKTVREARGWTQADLARACYTTRQHIHRIESGIGVPSFETALRIAKALDVDMETFAKWRK